MSTASTLYNDNLASAVNQLLNFPETIVEKFVYPSFARSSKPKQPKEAHLASPSTSSKVETPKGYVFDMDIPGFSKPDIQVTVENDRVMVIRSNTKQEKREEGGDEGGCKYIRLERRTSQKFIRKFRLPDDSNVSTISANCENGVLTVTVEKLPPPPKSNTVQVAIY